MKDIKLTHEFVKRHAEQLPYHAQIIYGIISSNPKISLKAISDEWGISYPTVRYSSILLQDAGLIKNTQAGFIVRAKVSKLQRLKEATPELERALHSAIAAALHSHKRYREYNYEYTKYSKILMQKLIEAGIASEQAAVQYVRWLLSEKSSLTLSIPLIASGSMTDEYKRIHADKKRTSMKQDKSAFAAMQKKYSGG